MLFSITSCTHTAIAQLSPFYVVLFSFRKRKSAAHNSTTDDQQPEYDITYYSTTEETLKNFLNTPERQDLSNGSETFPV